MSGSKRTHQTRAGMSAGSKEKERKASAERRKRHVSRVCAEAGPTSGDTRGEGAEAARGRCGGERAPLGELGVDEQRAGMSAVTRPACRELRDVTDAGAEWQSDGAAAKRAHGAALHLRAVAPARSTRCRRHQGGGLARRGHKGAQRGRAANLWQLHSGRYMVIDLALCEGRGAPPRSPCPARCGRCHCVPCSCVLQGDRP